MLNVSNTVTMSSVNNTNENWWSVTIGYAAGKKVPKDDKYLIILVEIFVICSVNDDVDELGIGELTRVTLSVYKYR